MREQTFSQSLHENGAAYGAIADWGLDEQLEQLQRHYAAATRAVSKARFELELLRKSDDIPEHMVAHARRQLDAAEKRAAMLLRQIDALEDRLEDA